MQDLAKMLVALGGFLVLIGFGLYFASKIPGLGRLPGDIIIKKDNFSFYFPLTTCLVISMLISLILYLFNRR